MGSRTMPRFNDVSRAYQRHIAGVSNCVHRLLRWLIRAVMCYHELTLNRHLGFISAYVLRDMMSQYVTETYTFFELMMHMDANTRYIYIHLFYFINFVM